MTIFLGGSWPEAAQNLVRGAWCGLYEIHYLTKNDVVDLSFCQYDDPSPRLVKKLTNRLRIVKAGQQWFSLRQNGNAVFLYPTPDYKFLCEYLDMTFESYEDAQKHFQSVEVAVERGDLVPIED
jgi:hypothetical protein